MKRLARNIKVKRNGNILIFMVDGQYINVTWDITALDAGKTAGLLYPKMIDQVTKTLRSRLESSIPHLTEEEIELLIVAAMKEVDLK